MIYRMAEAIETRWDGITTVSATIGITAVAVSGIIAGEVTTEAVYLTVAALSGIGGYSMHNLVRRSGGKR